MSLQYGSTGERDALVDVSRTSDGFTFLLNGVRKIVNTSQVPTGITLRLNNKEYHVTEPVDGGGGSSIASIFAPAPATDSNVYIMLGHGGEDLVDPKERYVIPPGFTLVTLSVCGVSTYTKNVKALMTKFKALRALGADKLRNPKANSADIERRLGFPIRVYNPGDRYPLLRYWSTAVHGDKYLLSGIVDLDKLTDADITASYTPRQFTGSQADIANAHRKNVANRVYEGSPMQEIFNAFPKGGVFYFTACRNIVDESAPPEKIQLVREFSDEQQRRTGGTKSRTKRMKKRLTRRRKYGARITAM